MVLIEDWKDSWRYASVQATATAGTMATIVAGYPDLMIMLIELLGGSNGLQAMIISITILILALRLWNQSEEEDDGENS